MRGVSRWRSCIPSLAAHDPQRRQTRFAPRSRVLAPESELGRVAYEVADLYRAGKLPGIPSSTQFPVPHLAKEIERRLPGRESDDYKIVASKALHWSR
jgi:hypothetical protein